jgi:hypothetical protein
MAKLESLIVDLKLNSAELRKGIDAANSKIDSLGKKVSSLSGTISFGMVAKAAASAVTHLVEFVRHGAEVADQMGKMAQGAGVSVESLSRLDYSAKLSGLSTEELGRGLKNLNKNLSEAGAGGKEQVRLFNALGVAVKDSAGNVRSADVVFADLSEKFAGMERGASKAGLAGKLFGEKIGERMIPMLNLGKDGLSKLSAEADRFGVTISSKTAKASEEFNDNMTRLGVALTRVGTRVAGEVAPAFTKLTSWLLESKEGAAALKTIVTILSGAMRVLASLAIAVGAAFQVVGTAIAGIAASAVEFLSGNFEGSVEIVKDTWKELGEQVQVASDLMGKAWSDSADDAESGSRRMVESADEVARAASDMGKKLAEAQAAHAFEFEQKAKATTRGMEERLQAHANRNRDPGDVARGFTEGFKDFEDAVAKSADAIHARDKLLQLSADRKAVEDMEGSRRLEAMAGDFDILSEKANRAAESFEVLEELSERAGREFGAAVAAIGMQFASKLGELGSVINAAVQGAQSGGVWGALIAVIIELLSKFERFSEIMDIANGAVAMALKDMAAGFNALIDGLRPLFGAISMIAKALHSILGPILVIVGKIFQQIAATLVPLGIIFQTIAASLEPLFQIIGAVVDILKIFQPILAIVSLSMMAMKLAIQYVTLGFNMFVDWVLEFFGGNNNSGVIAAQNAVNTTQNEMIALAKKLEKDPLNAMTATANDAANELEQLGKEASATKDAKENETKATEKATTALDRLSAQFTNIPEGFKLALRRFQATDAIEGGALAAAGGGGSTTINVHGSLISERELAREVAQGQGRRNFQRGGTWTP